MKIEVKTIVRSVAELTDQQVLAFSPNARKMTVSSSSVIRAYQSNPFLDNEDQPAEKIGVVGNRVIGSVGTMPMPLWADGKEYITSANPDSRVDPEYRKTGYALELMDFGIASAKDGIRVDFYVSLQARKVLKLLGASVFDIRQFAVVRDSSLFFAKRFPSWCSWVGCRLLNVCFSFHRLFLQIFVAFHTRSWRFELADDDHSLDEFAQLVERDPHRFRPNASRLFYQWILKHDFGGIENADKHLWRVSRRGVLIGFVMTRRSGSGRGRIIDWQLPPEGEINTPYLLLSASNRCLRSCKAVVLSISGGDVGLCSFLHRLLPRLPLQAATVDAAANSPLQKHEGWRDQANWRIRPTMGDSGLY